MNCIRTSAFDIFKIGPGPSSSHTIGPMKAANSFINAANQLPDNTVKRAAKVRVTLYGSLSLTGKGHGTDRAICAGLLGMQPDNCDPDAVTALLQPNSPPHVLTLGGSQITFSANDIIFDNSDTPLKFSNTMSIALLDSDHTPILEKTYYSIGGGFIRCEGENETERPIPPHQFANFHQFKGLTRRTGLSHIRILLDNEKALTGMTEDNILAKLDSIIEAMCAAVKNGLQQEGVLPGKIGLERKARDLFLRSGSAATELDCQLLRLNAYAMAASEEHAAGRIVVTAPTSGASGLLPGIIHFLREHHHASPQSLREALLVAALIASIAKHNASISGAEVGCQGEVGVAAAMAAAFTAHVKGLSLRIIENAAESALEHHLGMTCDPIGGYVQIPCIERNAAGAVAAYNACVLTSGTNPDKHKLSFDEVIEAMLETGRDMSSCYKETSKGGLAICSISC